jgi:pimeloyl-ACP methyl ester carboxylesterase
MTNGERPVRQKMEFVSGGARCAAWHYPGTSGACVVMAGGFAVPKEPATDRFGAGFVAAGFSVLAFDYRGLGESDGEPRLVQSVKNIVADWKAAIARARALPEVDPTKVAIWGFSASGGFVLEVAASTPGVAAAIAQTPLASAPAAAPRLGRYSTPWAQLRLVSLGLIDMVGGALGRDPILVPLTGERGQIAMLSTPDALLGAEALNASRYPQWEQRVAARSVLTLGGYRPIRFAPRIACPLLVVVCEDDLSSPPTLARRVALRAPRAELFTAVGRHYAPFIEAHDEVLAGEVSFLNRHLVAPAGEAFGDETRTRGDSCGLTAPP